MVWKWYPRPSPRPVGAVCRRHRRGTLVQFRGAADGNEEVSQRGVDKATIKDVRVRVESPRTRTLLSALQRDEFFAWNARRVACIEEGLSLPLYVRCKQQSHHKPDLFDCFCSTFPISVKPSFLNGCRDWNLLKLVLFDVNGQNRLFECDIQHRHSISVFASSDVVAAGPTTRAGHSLFRRLFDLRNKPLFLWTPTPFCFHRWKQPVVEQMTRVNRYNEADIGRDKGLK